jgi:hypothetical protein
MARLKARPVKQHYVPQCYLRWFATPRKGGHHVAVFDRKKRKNASYRCNVKDVACQNYFNRILLDGMDPDELEKAMSRFEAGLASALERINESRTLENEDDRAYLITLIGLTALRNPSMREQIRGLAKQAANLSMLARLQTKERYDASIEEAKNLGALRPDYNVTYEEMKAAFESGCFKIEMDNTAMVSNELELLDHVLPLLFRRGWHLLRAPAHSGGFITSDRPFYLTWSNPVMRGGPPAPGLALAGTDIYFPISPSLAVVGAFNVGHTIEDIDEDRVAMCNSAMADGADRQVYARNQKFFYARTSREARRAGNQLITDNRFLHKPGSQNKPPNADGRRTS